MENKISEYEASQKKKQCPGDLLEIKKKKKQKVFSAAHKGTNFMVIHYSKIYVGCFRVLEGRIIWHSAYTCKPQA